MKYIKKFIVVSNHGLHIRTIAKIVEAVNIFKSSIVFTYNNIPADAKSIMEMLGMGVSMGEQLLVTIEGVDSAEAMAALRKIDCLKESARLL